MTGKLPVSVLSLGARHILGLIHHKRIEGFQNAHLKHFTHQNKKLNFEFITLVSLDSASRLLGVPPKSIRLSLSPFLLME